MGVASASQTIHARAELTRAGFMGPVEITIESGSIGVVGPSVDRSTRLGQLVLSGILLFAGAFGLVLGQLVEGAFLVLLGCATYAAGYLVLRATAVTRRTQFDRAATRYLPGAMTFAPVDLIYGLSFLGFVVSVLDRPVVFSAAASGGTSPVRIVVRPSTNGERAALVAALSATGGGDG